VAPTPASTLAGVDGLQRLDVADLRRRFRCSRPTIERWILRGLLPPPSFLLQRRVWDLGAIEDAERKLNALHDTAVGGVAGAGLARRAAARAAEARELGQLEAAAAAFLSRRSVGDLARVVGRFTRDGKIASIPSATRAAARRALGAA
jgi:hypothetical protein